MYVGNIPIKLSIRRIREQFMGCLSIQIGFRRGVKYERYAYIQYKTVDETIAAFRNTFNWDTGEQSLVLRFHRTKIRTQVRTFFCLIVLNTLISILLLLRPQIIERKLEFQNHLLIMLINYLKMNHYQQRIIWLKKI